MDDITVSAKLRGETLAFPAKASWRPEGCDRIALVLQGGGALGAYQAGVYEAMHEAGVEPDWVSGVSIGAINSAIIAGNPPNRRLRQLQAFWENITDRRILAVHPGRGRIPQGA
jgi:NTE family protein